MNGFSNVIDNIVTIPSTRTDKSGIDHNSESFEDGVWTIKVGDSAEAWAKAFGKLLAGKYSAHTLVIDTTRIRPAGGRLSGYGWISSGDTALLRALVKITEILNKKAGQLLDKIDCLDILNWMGTTLSSRRSAEICVLDYDTPQWEEFALAKKNYWSDNPQRAQSNNSLLFWNRPSKLELKGLFHMMIDAGGSEPGFINAAEAQRRAPWFKGVNPCAEILLGNKSFCNLVETNLAAFNGRLEDLFEAINIIGRANYRQTCVNLDDGILQRGWHELNQYLRLTGVGVTGIVGWEFRDSEYHWNELRRAAIDAVDGMADELNLPHSKAVTTIKPSGTLSKVMDTTEGAHKPLGKYIFNNVNFSKHDPSLSKLKSANYRIFQNPNDPDAIVVTLPVKWNNVEFDVVDGVEVNLESAISQLERYKLLMGNYVDHNCSITISYDPSEVDEIVSWLYENWDSFVGVSWLFRNDPTKTAKDLGYEYLPQEVVTKDQYYEYVNTLLPVNLDEDSGKYELDDDECASGMCPVK